jgi:hypothetical protein
MNKDDERLNDTSEAFIYVAMTRGRVSAIPRTCTGSRTSYRTTNPKQSRLLFLSRQEIDDDPGVKAAVAGAWQDGELRVGESFAQGEGVLHGDLLVAISDHD